MTQNSAHKRGWILYDFANSSYHLLIPTILMPLYFREYLASSAKAPDFIWALLISVPVILAGIIAPFLGAVADYLNSRLKFLTITALVAICFVALVSTTREGDLITGGVFFCFSYFFFILSLGLYDSFLPIISDSSNSGRLSGLGWGIGYLGGIVALIFVFPFLTNAKLPGDVSAFKKSILIVSALFCLFAALSFWFMKGISNEKRAFSSLKETLNDSFRALKRVPQTMIEWRKRTDLFKLLISYYLANDGLATAVYFTSIYAASTLGFSSQQILILFLIVQLVGIPSTIFGGLLADKIGHKTVLFFTLGIWAILSLLFSVSSGVGIFYALSVGTGLVIGTTPAVYRSYIASFVEPGKTAELYGFGSLASRASSVVGPLLFGVISTVTGSQRIAMATLLLFFVFASLILTTVTIRNKID